MPSAKPLDIDAETLLAPSFAPSNANVPFSILRLAGIDGPNCLLISVDRLRSGRPLAGNPNAWLNLIRVDDAVTAVQACERRGRSGDVFLVCDDQPLTRREYYDTLASYVGVPSVTFEATGTDRAEGEHKNKRCRNKSLREDLGVQLAYPSISVGLKNAVGIG